MLKADARTKQIFDKLQPQVDAALKPYAGRNLGNMPVQHMISGPLRKLAVEVNGADIPETEFRRWVKFEPHPDTGIEIKVNHTLMADSGRDTPEWVYALLWSFNPNFKPHFNT